MIRDEHLPINKYLCNMLKQFYVFSLLLEFQNKQKLIETLSNLT